MRCPTVNEIKRHKQFDKYQKPKEGTALRKYYDLFTENKGLPVQVAVKSTLPNAFTGVRLEQLRSRYGLDIRRLRTKEWVLVGEWDGRVYIDYIAERMSKDDYLGGTSPERDESAGA